MKIKRLIQFITGVHRIHHIYLSYGYKLPFVNIGYFDDYGFKRFTDLRYHNCTKTGIY